MTRVAPTNKKTKTIENMNSIKLRYANKYVKAETPRVKETIQ
jgi:hypothetical protein